MAGAGAGAARDGLDFQVPAGQSVAVFSRPHRLAADVLDMIGGLRRPAAGRVVVDGMAVHRLRGQELDRFRSARGLVSMRFPLLPTLSVIDNLLVAPSSRHLAGQAKQRASWLLDVTGVADVRDDAAGSLSSGQQWRVMIGRALMPAPWLVLAEDPVPGLDPAGAAAVLALLQQLQADLQFTLLLATGRPAAVSFCQRVIGLSEWQITEDELIADDDSWTASRVDRIG